MDWYVIVSPDNSLYHHGIKGQRWGVRRFQNEDGSLTNKGKARYGINGTGKTRKELNEELSDTAYQKVKELREKYGYNKREAELYKRTANKDDLDYDDEMEEYKLADLDDRIDKEARKYAKETFIKKYGKKTMDELDATNAQVVAGKAIAAVVLPVIGAWAISAIKNAGANRESKASYERLNKMASAVLSRR